MLTKKEIMILVNRAKLSTELQSFVDMILRNYLDDEQISNEKLEIVCKLIIKE